MVTIKLANADVERFRSLLRCFLIEVRADLAEETNNGYIKELRNQEAMVKKVLAQLDSGESSR